MKIFNEFGSKIPTIIFSYENNFIHPFSIIDKLRGKELPEKIRIEKHISYLQDVDFVLYCKSLKKKFAWLRGQKLMFILRPGEYAKEPGWRQLTKLPIDHHFEIDVANHKIRLVGPFTHPSGYGEWIYY